MLPPHEKSCFAGEIDVSTQPVLSWTPADGAGSYVVTISSSGTYYAPSFSDKGTSYDVSGSPLSQLLPGVTYFWQVEAVASFGQTGFLPQLREDDAFRTNIRLTNIGSSAAAATVTLFDGDGKTLTTYQVTLAPGEWKQETRPLFSLAGQ